MFRREKKPHVKHLKISKPVVGDGDSLSSAVEYKGKPFCVVGSDGFKCPICICDRGYLNPVASNEPERIKLIRERYDDMVEGMIEHFQYEHALD